MRNWKEKISFVKTPLGVSHLFVVVHQLMEIIARHILKVGLMILLKANVSSSFTEAVEGLKTCSNPKKLVRKLVYKNLYKIPR